MLRKIITINEELCDGCGDCVPACHEGALQIIDGKARLISDLFCDGLGACLGECHSGALQIVEREAEPYNETKVMEYIVKGGPNVIKAHLEHLLDHNEIEFFTEALDYLKAHGIVNPVALQPEGSPSTNQQEQQHNHGGGCGCKGSAPQELKRAEPRKKMEFVGEEQPSELTHWPIQLHLLNPQAGFFRNADLLLAADCAGFVSTAFHSKYLSGKAMAIACPKLDSNKEAYLEKLVDMIDYSNLNSMSVIIMKVPCCSGLAQLAMKANQLAVRKIPVYITVLDLDGSELETYRAA
ncbi:4Fe-4S binding protein [Ignavibacteriales bacterium]